MSQPGGQVIVNNAVTNTALLVVSGRRQIVAARFIATAAITGDQYLQMFDAAAIASVTLGTTKPTWVVMADGATGQTSLGDGLPTHGLIFDNGIVIAITANAEDAAAATPTTADVRIVVI